LTPRVAPHKDQGAALVILGEREKGRHGPARGSCHRLCRRGRTRIRRSFGRRPKKHSPSAISQFGKSNEPTHRDDALNVIGGAFEGYGKAKAAFYIETATRLREKILAARDGKL
jgi:hypothetical protein